AVQAGDNPVSLLVGRRFGRGTKLCATENYTGRILGQAGGPLTVVHRPSRAVPRQVHSCPQTFPHLCATSLLRLSRACAEITRVDPGMRKPPGRGTGAAAGRAESSGENENGSVGRAAQWDGRLSGYGRF